MMRRLFPTATSPVFCSKTATGPRWRGATGPSWFVPLVDRSVVHVHGPQARQFLQNLLTQDLNDLAPTAAGDDSPLQIKTQTTLTKDSFCAGYAAFLSKDSRMLFDAVVVPHQVLESTEGGNRFATSFLLDVPKAAVNALVKHLKLFKLRTKVTIDHAEDDFAVWAVGGSDARELTGAFSLKNFGDGGLKLLVDPRTASLGVRVIAPQSAPPLRLPPGFTQVELSDYQALRFAEGVGECPTDFDSGSLVPLECNLVEMNGVSFDKGCYLGQELVARVHHTGVIRKRVLPLWFDDATEPPQAGDSIVVEEGGKTAGKVLAVCGKVGLGMVRVEHAFRNLVTNGTPTTVSIPSHLEDVVVSEEQKKLLEEKQKKADSFF